MRLVFYNLYRRELYFNSMNHFVTMKSNVLNKFVPYLEPFFARIFPVKCVKRVG